MNNDKCPSCGSEEVINLWVLLNEFDYIKSCQKCGIVYFPDEDRTFFNQNLSKNEMNKKVIPKNILVESVAYSNDFFIEGECECGQRVINEFSFCPYCGAKLN